MFKDAQTFSSYSIDDVDAAQAFYGDTLGLDVEKTDMGFPSSISTTAATSTSTRSPITVLATFTVLNFIVPDVDSGSMILSRRASRWSTTTSPR